jgi:subtilisin family serine protease
MKRAALFYAALLLLSGCGNGRSGGPDDPVANGTQGQRNVHIGEKEVTTKPYIHRSGSGGGAISITLKKGINLIGLQYDHYDDDYSKEATATLSREGADFFHLVARESEEDAAYLKTFAMAEGASCRVVVGTDDSRDGWELRVYHKDDLGEIKTEIKDPTEVYEVPGEDPLFPYQWHLKNSGQSDYVIFNAVAGEDINVEPVWEQGLSGRGVTVAVVDEGVEINHPDLAANIDIKGCWNYLTRSHDTSPTDANNAHGTAVAGIIAASAHNGIGGRGVAPNATLVSLNMLESQGIVDWSLPLESLVRGLDSIDIYNNSWGYIAGALQPNPNNTYASLYLQFANQLAYGTKFGRGGKGAVYVKSAGNDRKNYVDGEWRPYWNANFAPEQVERYMIVVGASDADGGYSWYSTPGANLLVNAPGGDTQPNYLEADHHMIATTDLSGKQAGYDYQDDNLIDYHFDAEGNENYDYTDRMNGTSSAGPVVSGVVALMLEANPELSWRDVRYILATTATKNGSGYLLNAAGHRFSNDYGFGRVDAAAAVAAAKGWQPLGTEYGIGADASGGDASDVDGYAFFEQQFGIGSDMKVEYVNALFSVAAVSEETVSFKNDAEEPTQRLAGGIYRAVFELSNAQKPYSGGELYDDETVDVALNCGQDTSGENIMIPVFTNLKLTDGIIPEAKAEAVPVDVQDKKCSVSFTADSGADIATHATWSLTLEKGAPLPASNTLKVTLVSPSGTESVVIGAPNGLSGDAELVNMRVGSNAFLDEDSGGVWSLRMEEVEDPDHPKEAGDQRTFRAEDLRLEIYGRK